VEGKPGEIDISSTSFVIAKDLWDFGPSSIVMQDTTRQLMHAQVVIS